MTILSTKSKGQTVNLENDIIGKYVEKLMKPAENVKNSGIDMSFLSSNGFI
jgi:riboflavin synthase